MVKRPTFHARVTHSGHYSYYFFCASSRQHATDSFISQTAFEDIRTGVRLSWGGPFNQNAERKHRDVSSPTLDHGKLINHECRSFSESRGKKAEREEMKHQNDARDGDMLTRT